MTPQLKERIRLFKLKQETCEHNWKKVKYTWTSKGVVTEIERILKCSKCKKEKPRE